MRAMSEREPNVNEGRDARARELADEITALRDKLEKGTLEDEGALLSKISELEELYGSERREREDFLEKHRFKTIKLGTFESAGNLNDAITDAGCVINEPAKLMLMDIDLSAIEGDVDLFIVKPSELGLLGSLSLKEIYERAAEKGLGVCPAEVGPQLRLQYLDQPKKEKLFIAMEPFTASNGNLVIFEVENAMDEPWLSAFWKLPKNDIKEEDRFVFKRREKLDK